MDINEYLGVKDFNYEEYCKYLQDKYGLSKSPYFNSNWNKNTKKISRTDEGLFCHHIKEDRGIMLSSPEFAMNNPYEYQLPENLVYCDYLEHLFLHILICEYPSTEKNKDEEVGVGGVLNFLIPELNDLYAGYKPKQDWRINIYNKVKNDKSVYLILLKRFYDFYMKPKNINEFYLLTSAYCKYNNIKPGEMYKELFYEIYSALNDKDIISESASNKTKEKTYRFIPIYIKELSEEKYFYCNDDRIEVGDFVICERIEEPQQVKRIEVWNESELPKRLDTFPKILRLYCKGTLNEAKEETKVINQYKEEKLNENPEFEIKCKVLDEFSYADYHSDCLFKTKNKELLTSEFSFISNLEVINSTDDDFENLKLRFIFDSDIFSLDDILISSLNSYIKISINKPLFLKVDREKLSLIDTEMPALLKINLCNEKDEILTTFERMFSILPISQPSCLASFDNRIYAKYVTPQDERVKALTLSLIKYNEKAIISYQNEDKNSMLKEIESLYNALHDYGINYQNPPAGGLYKTLGKTGVQINSQKIRMPGEVLKDKKGTCLDLSILMCACLEEVGYHSILAINRSHAFVGIFLEEDECFDRGIETNVAPLYNKSSSKISKIIFVDAVSFVSDSTTSFKDTMIQAREYLHEYDDIFSAVDINSCHKMVFSPIPCNKDDDEQLDKDINIAKLDEGKLYEIEEQEFIDARKEEIKDRFTFWQRKLLDLTEANPLVNFNKRDNNSISLISGIDLTSLLKEKDSFKFFDYGTESEKLSFLNSLSKDSEYQQIEESLKKNNKEEIITFASPTTIKNIIKKSDSAEEETGSPTLYLCLGTISFPRKKRGIRGKAPFMVLPIRIIKNRTDSSNIYTVKYDYENLMLNQSFFEYYKLEHESADFSALYNFNKDLNYSDYVRSFVEHCASNIDLELETKDIFICNLTFAHYIMWLDVKNRKEELGKNKIIHSIIENKNLIEDEVIDDNVNIDNLENYHDFAAPLSYDSSQLKAILDCGRGNSFILDGPPGTGKSQTIVNMIVNAFYHQKTVLFVAEKKAALDVVSDRLKKLKLDRFCLELHSNKANKADFFMKLKESMEYGQLEEAKNFDEKCEQLNKKKNELSLIINKMHEKKYFYSLYDVIINLENLKDFKNDIIFDESFLNSLTNSSKKIEIEDTIKELLVRKSALINYQESSLRYLNIEDLNYNQEDDIKKYFNNLSLSFSDFISSYSKFVKNNKLSIKEDLNTIDLVIEILNLSYNEPVYLSSLDKFLFNNDDQLNLEVFNKTKEYLKLKDDHKNTYDLNKILDIDGEIALKELGAKLSFFKRMSVKKKYLKLLKTVISPTIKIKKKDIYTYYNFIKYYNTLYKFIKDNSLYLNEIIKDNYLLKIDDVLNIEKTYLNTCEFINKLSELSKLTSDEISKEIRKLACSNDFDIKLEFKSLKELYDKFNSYKKDNYFNIDYKNISSSKNNIKVYKSLLNKLTDEFDINELIDLVSLNIELSKLEDLGLTEFVKEIKLNKIDMSYLSNYFNYAVSNGYKNLYFNDNDINYFSSIKYGNDIETYKKLIDEYSTIVVEEVATKLSSKLNHNLFKSVDSSPIGRLKKSISNNGRGTSIRETLLNYDNTIKTYFPCFLMSPLSAAQYLAMDKEKSVSKFDIVIFDEASQIPTHEAVGAIARGNSLIVAGDPEQMPPSAYFSAGLELEKEDVQYEDATSLLDECLAIELPRHRLNYHYRSKHESLISFSNNKFYASSLHTFPSIDNSSIKIHFEEVKLEKNKESSDISKEELDAITNRFKEIYTNEETRNMSLGIIVFNMKQQDAVSEAISKLLEKDKVLKQTVEKVEENKKEHWFVKSLENVQGDERDIIIISIGFRKNAAGNAIINGPLTRENGQRRLNVAVSRSKEMMYIISTIRYSDCNNIKLNSMGAQMLRDFLGFVENKEFNNFNIKTNDSNSLAYFLKEDLTKLGYNVDLNVGNSDYKVDVAIKDKDGKYTLGILLDNENLNNTVSFRDKTYVEEKVLNSLKWRTINIYSLEYFKDRKKVIEKIEKALKKDYVKEETIITPTLIKKDVEIMKNQYEPKEYIKSKRLGRLRYQDQVFCKNYYGNNSDNIDCFLRNLVEDEAPISFSLIKKRVRDNCRDISKIGPNIERIIKDSLRYSSGMQREDDQDDIVYYNGSSRVLSYFRVAGERDITEIPKEEILCAFNKILSIQGSISSEDLFRETLIAFEYTTKLTEKNIRRLNYVLKRAEAKNLLIEKVNN